MKRPWPPPFFGLSFVQGCYAVCLTWTDTNDTCGCLLCLRQASVDVSANNLSGCFPQPQQHENIVASPVGKHSASGEARYSVTPFKEAETDLPPEAYAPSGAAPPPLIRTPLLTPAETCLKKPCTSIRPFTTVTAWKASTGCWKNSKPTLPGSRPKPDAPATGYAYIFVKHTCPSSGVNPSPPKN